PLLTGALARARTLLVRSIAGIVHAGIRRCAWRTEVEARAGAARQAREVAARAWMKRARRRGAADGGQGHRGARRRLSARRGRERGNTLRTLRRNRALRSGAMTTSDDPGDDREH